MLPALIEPRLTYSWLISLSLYDVPKLLPSISWAIVGRQDQRETKVKKEAKVTQGPEVWKDRAVYKR